MVPDILFHPLSLQLSYEEATCLLQQLHGQWKDSLAISEGDRESAAVRQLGAAVSLYLRKMSSKQDVTNIIQVKMGAAI